jgi:hypothetical protein
LKTSRYFANLISTYQAELDDLRTDSEGNNVLKARLARKREQVPQLLMMMQSAPEMVAVAFHGGFGFKQSKLLETLVAKESGRLLAWEALQPALTIEPWAQSLIKSVLTDPDGEHFLATTVGLEFLLKRKHTSNAAQDEQHQNDEDHDDEHNHDDVQEDHDRNDDYLSSDDRISDEGEGSEFDLDRAGADFLAEQGFDRKE